MRSYTYVHVRFHDVVVVICQEKSALDCGLRDLPAFARALRPGKPAKRTLR